MKVKLEFIVFPIFLCFTLFPKAKYECTTFFRIKGKIVKAFAANERLFLGVNSSRKAAVLVVELKKKSFRKIGNFGKKKNEYYFVQDLNVNLDLRRIFVLDRMGKVLIYDLEGNFKKALSLNLICSSFLETSGPERFMIQCIKGNKKKRKIYTEIYLYEKGNLKKILSFPNLTVILKGNPPFLLSLSEPAIAFDGKYFYVQTSSLYEIHKFDDKGRRILSKTIDKAEPDFSKREKLLRGKIIRGKKPFAACRLFWDKNRLWVLTNIWKGEKRRLDLLNENLKKLNSFFVKGACRYFWISNGFMIIYDPRSSLLSINALILKNEMSKK